MTLNKMTEKYTIKIMRPRAMLLVAGFLLFFGALVPGRPAHALTCICSCALSEASVTANLIISEHTQTRAYFGTTQPIPPWPNGSPAGTGRLGQHQNFLLWDMFLDRILPAMMMMTEQMTAVMMQQALIIGGYFDAKHQLESQLLFQDLTMQAHKDYHPSHALCEFGTTARSLAAAEHNGEFNAFVMNKAYLDRQLGNLYNNAAEGPSTDRSGNQFAATAGRTGQLREQFCNYRDMNRWPDNDNSGLFFCNQDQPLQDATVNLDVDFTRLVMMPRIINADFSDNDLDINDHSALLAMSKNLYGHDVLRRDRLRLENENHQNEYIDARAVVAKRSVAQNSFNNIVALKTRGTSETNQQGRNGRGGLPASNSSETAEYFKVILEQLGGRDVWDEAALNFPTGVSQSEGMNRYLTNRHDFIDQMSYYAQMEFLAKKLYQRPEFYTNLYDKPANIERQSVAMQAIGTMLDRDIYNSWLRSEMLLSMILETKVIREQDRVQDHLYRLERDSPGTETNP